MDTPTYESKGETRSHRAVLSWELAGVVNALRLTAPYCLAPGRATITLIAKLRDQIEARGEKGLGVSGVALDNIPRLDDQSNPVEVLVVAEALNGLIQCLLEPDERQEQQRFMGFHQPYSGEGGAKS